MKHTRQHHETENAEVGCDMKCMRKRYEMSTTPFRQSVLNDARWYIRELELGHMLCDDSWWWSSMASSLALDTVQSSLRSRSDDLLILIYSLQPRPRPPLQWWSSLRAAFYSHTWQEQWSTRREDPSAPPELSHSTAPH